MFWAILNLWTYFRSVSYSLQAGVFVRDGGYPREIKSLTGSLLKVVPHFWNIHVCLHIKVSLGLKTLFKLFNLVGILELVFICLSFHHYGSISRKVGIEHWCLRQDQLVCTSSYIQTHTFCMRRDVRVHTTSLNINQ